jgi:hypothetical protein
MSRCFDAFIYNGEAEVVDIRVRELSDVVDRHFVVEASHTFSGKPKNLRFLSDAKRMGWPLEKFDYLTLSDTNVDENPWVNEKRLRNSISEVVNVSQGSDLILISDADEIPSANAVREMRDLATEFEKQFFGFVQTLSYFKLNYQLVNGPEALQVWSVACRAQDFIRFSPEELRIGIRERKIESQFLEDGGWHFSYLFDDEGIREKIKSFSHQEFNTRDFLAQIDVEKFLSEKLDLYNRQNYQWEIVDTDFLPDSVKADLPQFEKWINKSFV